MFANPVFINPGRYIFKLIKVVIPRGEPSAERSEFIISSRAKDMDPRELQTRSAHLYLYPMVSTMTSYSRLTSRRIFCF